MPLNSGKGTKFIGIDGGGSKTSCVLGDGEGRLLAFQTGPAGNMKSKPWDSVKEVLSGLIGQVLELGSTPPDDVNTVLLGMAGGDRSEDSDRITGYLAELLPSHVQIVVKNDALPALAAGTWGEAGIIVIAGTGSIACSYVPETGVYRRAGGWGYVLGDEGSGYDIGRRALQSVMRAFDGRGPDTSLTQHVLAHLQLNAPGDLITCIYEHADMRKTVAGLAPTVAAAAAGGDGIAGGIMDDAAKELALLAETVASPTSSQRLPVIVSGGLFFHGDFLQRFRELISGLPGVEQVILPSLPPVIGSYVLAMQAGGVVLSDTMKRRITQEWENRRESV